GPGRRDHRLRGGGRFPLSGVCRRPVRAGGPGRRPGKDPDMVTLQRWGNAQDYELGYWQQQATEVAAGAISQLNWYQWRADQLVARLRELGLTSLTTGQARVIEVGSGPVGVAGAFPAQERVAIDPLAEQYARLPGLTELRSKEVRYLKGVGE